MELRGFYLDILLDCVNSPRELQRLKANRKKMFESFYEDFTSVQVDVSSGKVMKISYDAESAALAIIDNKKAYDNHIKYTEQKNEMFHKMMATLSADEQKAISTYLSDRNELPQDFPPYLQPILRKLCNFIRDELLKQKNQYERELKEKRKEKVRKYLEKA